MTEPTIVAIGGMGDLGRDDTEPIDRYIVSLAGKEHPRVLFISTASQDAPDYCRNFQYWYDLYGCETNVLRLTKRDYTREALEAAVMMSDIIYVGGGNTLFLYNYWRALGVDQILRAAWERGIILSGLSAGCIIWHEQGLSDSIAGAWTPIYGLGFVPGLVTPHYDGEPERQPAFRDLVRKSGGEGLAVEDRCALVYHELELAEVIAATPDSNAYRVRLVDGQVIETPIPKRVL
jgi:dipeptidase E